MSERISGVELSASDAGNVSMERLLVEYPRFSWKVFLIWVVAVTAVTIPYLKTTITTIYMKPGGGTEMRPAEWPVFVGAAVVTGVFSALLCYGGYVALRQARHHRMLRRLQVAKIEARTENLQEDLEQNFFTNLVKINFNYIDKYYLQTQTQADKSFLLCAVAASVSFLLILGGIVLLFVRPNAKEAGYIATASGTLGEFIAAVFFYLYNRTITKMGEYHQKLVLTQNICLALKISEELPSAEQVTARSKLIDYLSKDINWFLTARPIEEEKPSKKA
jgi:hypothetical protein